MPSGVRLIDAGTGEATTLMGVLSELRDRPARVAAFDIAWSRVAHARAHARGFPAPAPELFAGDMFALPVVAGGRLPETIAALKKDGLRVLAADGRAGVTLDDPATRESLSAPTAWLFGNEAWGLPDDLLALADESVAVPIYGRAESLNLASAAAVCMYASASAQRATAGLSGAREHLSSYYDYIALRPP